MKLDLSKYFSLEINTFHQTKYLVDINVGVIVSASVSEVHFSSDVEWEGLSRCPRACQVFVVCWDFTKYPPAPQEDFKEA